MGEMVGWQMKANPFIEATAKMLLIENYFRAKASESMLSRLKGKDITSMIVEIMRDPIAIGLSLKTKSSFFMKMELAKITNRIDWNSFFDIVSSKPSALFIALLTYDVDEEVEKDVAGQQIKYRSHHEEGSG